MLELSNVQFAYDNTTSYQFDLSVAPGEVVGISGPSGAGKSTLLDLIAGFLKPSHGDISLDGLSINKLDAEDRPVSILFQKNNVFPHLTAAQNVQLGSRDKIDQAASLAQVGLEAFAARKCDELSGGQQQRVALARTLVLNKPILLLDEPFSALDDDTADDMRSLVTHLVEKHQWRTILVSHQRQDFDALADRILTLREGKLEVQD